MNDLDVVYRRMLEWDGTGDSCARCRESFHVPSELETTALCNPCAQSITERLLDLIVERDRLKELLASSRAQCDYAQQRCIRMQQVVDAAIDWGPDLGCGGDSVDNLHRAIAAYKASS